MFTSKAIAGLLLKNGLLNQCEVVWRFNFESFPQLEVVQYCMIKFTFARTTYACKILLQGFTGMTGDSDTGINTLTVATI